MGLFGIFRSRDKPKNGTSGSTYPFLCGYSASGKRVNERTSMQMTAVYSCVGQGFKCSNPCSMGIAQLILKY